MEEKIFTISDIKISGKWAEFTFSDFDVPIVHDNFHLCSKSGYLLNAIERKFPNEDFLLYNGLNGLKGKQIKWHYKNPNWEISDLI